MRLGAKVAEFSARRVHVGGPRRRHHRSPRGRAPTIDARRAASVEPTTTAADPAPARPAASRRLVRGAGRSVPQHPGARHPRRDLGRLLQPELGVPELRQHHQPHPADRDDRDPRARHRVRAARRRDRPVVGGAVSGVCAAVAANLVVNHGLAAGGRHRGGVVAIGMVVAFIEAQIVIFGVPSLIVTLGGMVDPPGPAARRAAGRPSPSASAAPDYAKIASSARPDGVELRCSPRVGWARVLAGRGSAAPERRAGRLGSARAAVRGAVGGRRRSCSSASSRVLSHATGCRCRC